MNAKAPVNIPWEAAYILHILNNAGFEAYIVGGCVRDSIMGRLPGDWDITTSARPNEIKQLFEKTIDTGIQHGTVTVVIHGENFEVTTYRIDGDYLDNRHPAKVEYTSSLIDDLGRRDFTANAIAYHPVQGFIDPFGGIEDIEASLIRAVGDPIKRFEEDALRMMRCIRFSAQLDFSIEVSTFKAVGDRCHLINSVSQERIRDELTKTLVSQNPDRFVLLSDTGILKYILPQFEACFNTLQNNPYHIYSVARHSLQAAASIEKLPVLRWTMLLHDVGKPLTKTTDLKGIDHFYGHPEKSVEIAQTILKRLRFDNRSAGTILRLIRHHDRQVEPEYRAVRKAINAVGKDIFDYFLKVKEADIRAQSPEYMEERTKILERIRHIYKEIEDKEQCVTLASLAINGNDLINIGYKQGKEIRVALDKLLEVVIDEPDLNTKERLTEIVKSWNI